MFSVLIWFSRLISAVGAINWGSVAFFDVNLVEHVSQMVGVANLNKIIYAVVALSGIFSLFSLFNV